MADSKLRRIGDNSGNTSIEDDDTERRYASPDHAAQVRQINTELNYAAQEREALGAREREIKAALKAMGMPPKAITAFKSASKHKGGMQALFDLAISFGNDETYKPHRDALQEIADERREVSKTERGLREAANTHGVNLEALKLCRRMQAMDEVERKELFDGMVHYVNVFRFW